MEGDHLTGQTIEIKCKGATVANFRDLLPFQSDLKILTDENYQKLRRSIVEHGFTAPIQVWDFEGGRYTLDGHQRCRVLGRMAEEGFLIPEVPIDFVFASSYQEAKRILLTHASAYGTVTDQGLYEFMHDADLEMEDVHKLASFAEVDLYKFEENFFKETLEATNPNDEWKGMPEFTQNDKTAFRSLIIHFHDEAGLKTFLEATGIKITENTKMLWYPEMIIERANDKRYGAAES